MPSLDDDLEAIFACGEFTSCAVFSLEDGEGLRVSGHFTEASQSLSPYDGVTVVAVLPSFTCRTAALSGLTNKRSVEIDGRTWTVQKMEPTGAGTTVIWLKS